MSRTETAAQARTATGTGLSPAGPGHSCYAPLVRPGWTVTA
ncbi:hypothetical protein [Glycomyces sp. NPDC048151]